MRKKFFAAESESENRKTISVTWNKNRYESETVNR